MQIANTLADKQVLKAGRLQYHINEWQKLTSDKNILNTITGYKIDFMSPPEQTIAPKQSKLNAIEEQALDALIKELLDKQVIRECKHERGEFISPVFLRPKKNGKYRLILNLKKLNKNILPIHFKMDTIHSCMNLMKRNCFMASLDLTDAYYSVSIHQESQKYLKFQVKEQLFKYITLPNGLSSAPRIFTKLMKPVYSTLRTRGHISSGYLDDSFIMGVSYDQCLKNINDTYNLLLALGFQISEEKSITKPTKILEHLGFILNSVNMTVSLTKEKIENIRLLSQNALDNKTCTIREAAQLIGTYVSCSVGVPYGPLFYKQLEIDKIGALKNSKGDFQAYMHFSKAAREDIKWWLGDHQRFTKKIVQSNPDFTLTTDASLQGWGAHRQEVECTGGRWLPHEQVEHINYLELKAAKLGLQSLCNTESNVHIHLQLDNITAVAFINNMGGTHSLACNKIAREIWLWCISRKIWLSASHIPGVKNETADKLSRKFTDRTEWQLNPCIFNKLVDRWGKPEIDLFASRNNYQFKPFVSWRADPEAVAIDAFCLSWENKYVYVFPPFSMLLKTLQKIQEDQAQALLIAPLWRTQVWFPKIAHMLIKQPVLLPQDKFVLQLPHNRALPHPLWPKLKLMACLLSGKDSSNRKYQTELVRLSSLHGEAGRQGNIECISINGESIAQTEIRIPFIQL